MKGIGILGALAAVALLAGCGTDGGVVTNATPVVEEIVVEVEPKPISTEQTTPELVVEVEPEVEKPAEAAPQRPDGLVVFPGSPDISADQFANARVRSGPLDNGYVITHAGIKSFTDDPGATFESWYNGFSDLQRISWAGAWCGALLLQGVLPGDGVLTAEGDLVLRRIDPATGDILWQLTPERSLSVDGSSENWWCSIDGYFAHPSAGLINLETGEELLPAQRIIPDDVMLRYGFWNDNGYHRWHGGWEYNSDRDAMCRNNRCIVFVGDTHQMVILDENNNVINHWNYIDLGIMPGNFSQTTSEGIFIPASAGLVFISNDVIDR